MLVRLIIKLLSVFAALSLLAPTVVADGPGEDPTVQETGWGQLCVRGMLKFFEGKVDMGMVSAGELSALGTTPKVGETPDWDKLRDLEFVLVKLTGADLLTALGRSAKYMPRKNANLLHLQGLTVLCTKTGETNVVVAASVNNEPILPDQVYKVAMTKFLAEGGGPFVGLKSLEVVTKTPHSLARQIRLLLFPRGRIAAAKSSYLFPEGE
ncbi:MAG: hypothetical protein A2Y63_00345 [Candidatus Riflebacteria bacterium RBG_13_59_9]|nr:MAG: hypothetical protein A2Y63_00345 [Candidatus Riflebacteria bacterium RBG_13_59_9]